MSRKGSIIIVALSAAVVAAILWWISSVQHLYKCDGVAWGTSSLTVPASDATPPVATLKISQGVTGVVTSADATGKSFTLNGNEILKFQANGKDPESGIITTEIYYSETWWTKMPDGSELKQGPGGVGAPAAKNADSETSKNPGNSACNARNTNFQLDVAVQKKQATSYRVEVFARTINSFNQPAFTKVAILKWN